jgi:hypothetical protein
LFTGDDGKSYYEELVIPSVQAKASHVPLAGSLPVTAALFSQVAAGTSIEQHTAPRRQLLVMLEGRSVIGCAGGDREFGPGDIILADDVTGEGHTTTVLDHDLRAVVLPLPPDLDLADWRS